MYTHTSHQRILSLCLLLAINAQKVTQKMERKKNNIIKVLQWRGGQHKKHKHYFDVVSALASAAPIVSIVSIVVGVTQSTR